MTDLHHLDLHAIATRLKEVRNDSGLSQAEFAELLGTSLRSLAGYERAEREPSLELAVALFDRWQIDPIWLVKGSLATSKTRSDTDKPADLATALCSAWTRALAATTAPVSDESKDQFLRLIARTTFRGGAVPVDLIQDFIDIHSGR